MTDKPALRRELRKARDAFVAAPHGAITPSPEFLARLSPGVTVASYVPVGSEADPSLLARAATEAGCAIALPHIFDRSRPLRFLSWETEAMLAEGPFGLRQPAEDAAELRPEIVLTPLLGFDARGNRLGQGAGYYDRAFAAFSDAWRVGVAWSVQQVEALAIDPWDVPLHSIATEAGWITP